MSRHVLPRRRFLAGLGAAGSLSAFLGTGRSAFAASAGPAVPASSWPASLPPLEMELHITRRTIHLGGKSGVGYCINGRMPGPVLRWQEGREVRIHVHNDMDEPTSLHWHGVRLPSGQDGVPGLSYAGIPPRSVFTYHFPVQQSGTYWYHSHMGHQESAGMYGAIIIDPAGPSLLPEAQQDHVILLSDWSDVPAAEIVDNLKMDDDYYNFRQRSLASLPRESRDEGGLAAALKSRLQWSRMRMSATDISDVSGVLYRYLMNGEPAPHGWSGLFRPGEAVLLRVINAAAMTLFDVRVPGLEMLVVEADGNPVHPVPVDEFRIAPGETYAVILRLEKVQAYTIFAQSEDRTGYARGTLTPHYGQLGPLPPMDPRPVRGMADMGMAMAARGMRPEGTPPPKGMPPKGMSAVTHKQGHGAGHGTGHGTGMMAMAGMKDMPAPGGRPDEGMDSAFMKGETMDHAAMPGMAMPAAPPRVPADEIDDPGPPPLNVENQNIAAHPGERVSSPGDGLEGNGRRVLAYSDLVALSPPPDRRPPSREIILHLTGNMERYIWGFNGRKYSESGPIHLAYGERVRLTLINDTMMEHPIHLHGLWSELENGADDEYRPLKHTVISQPGSRVSVLVSADMRGVWAYHCHLMYHMQTGMFREIVVS